MAFLIDTHCHLNFNLFYEDLDAVLERAWEAGLQRILVPAIDLPTSREVVELCERHKGLFAAVGVHPNDAMTWQEGTLDELRQLARHPRVVAIGEIGLDYYREHAAHDQQMRVLRLQLELAAEIGKPVILHQRESQADLWPVMRTWRDELARHQHELARRPGVFHSFDGDLDAARQVTAEGFLVGVSGPVTYKNAQIRQEVVKGLPLECLLLETDAPFLTPHPWRGRRNEPAYVKIIGEKVAELRAQNLEMIAQITTKNANQWFGWGAAR